MKTSFGIHVLDEDGVFAPGELPEQSPPSAGTMMGRALGATVHGLQPDPRTHEAGPPPAGPGEAAAGQTSFGIRSPNFPVHTGRPASTATAVGAPNESRAPNATMVGLAALAAQTSELQPAPILGELEDGWVDDAFGAIGLGESVPNPSASPTAEDASSTALPDLVQPEVPGAPGFGIMRKKRAKRASISASPSEPVASAGSYENQRAESERIAAPSDAARHSGASAQPSRPVVQVAQGEEIPPVGHMPPVGQMPPIERVPPVDQMPPLRPAPVAHAKTQAMENGGPPQAPLGTLRLGVNEFAADYPAPAPVGDRLSPISVEAGNPVDNHKPLPLGASLPETAVKTPVVGARAVAGTMVFSPSAMAGAGAIPGQEPSEPAAEGPIYTADGGVFEPSDAQDKPANEFGPSSGAMSNRTMAFSPSLDLGASETSGVTHPAGGETLQLDSGAANDFLAFAAEISTSSSGPAGMERPSRPTSVTVSGGVAADRLRPPSRKMSESDDLFSVAANSGMTGADRPSAAKSAGLSGLTPPHMSDARRTSPDTVRQIVVVVSVLLLLAALSVLGILIYQEFTGGSGASGAPVLEGSG